MSKHHLRHDKTCANCGHEVEHRFCSSCGQENTETRQSFGHLVHHFIEDLTHYDGAFWRTMKYLLLRPAYLTKAYLAGKRNSFVPPVRLYIFISFVAFLLPHLLPDLHKQTPEEKRKAEAVAKVQKVKADRDTMIVVQEDTIQYKAGVGLGKKGRFTSQEQLDSFQHFAPADKRLSGVEYWIVKRMLLMNKDEDAGKKMVEMIGHNFPKTLFVYMPLFAFVIWLFHGKKRWLYFDHAIFTLHYFSFIMLLFSLISILSCLAELLPGQWQNRVSSILYLTMIIWWCYYFFRSHHKMYGERWIISVLKAWPVFLLNLLMFTIVMIMFVVFAFAMIH